MRLFQRNAHKQFCIYAVPKVDALVHLKLFAWTDFHVTFTLLITPQFSFCSAFCNSIVPGADFSMYASGTGLRDELARDLLGVPARKGC
jgi:hypothetical protein